jgi:hypothetical protein
MKIPSLIELTSISKIMINWWLLITLKFHSSNHSLNNYNWFWNWAARLFTDASILRQFRNITGINVHYRLRTKWKLVAWRQRVVGDDAVARKWALGRIAGLSQNQSVDLLIRTYRCAAGVRTRKWQWRPAKNLPLKRFEISRRIAKPTAGLWRPGGPPGASGPCVTVIETMPASSALASVTWG